ncbi:hypothetical protein [Burkholderia aenigmatica]|uniref:hypothetical protein n=1 Tax=Burkholderia aenigmatica TaxID=2015348 RepID=UPI00264D6526|nr:hypothetical protein [Burkholderia aenigmatica]MDN7877763.1 hypothetical protein [Burkholderia aenigmatica]
MTTLNEAVATVRDDQQANPSPSPVVQQTPHPPEQFKQLQAKQTREALSSPSDYLAAMWRQDSWIPGAIDHWAGSKLQPDDSYNPYDETTYQDLTDGVWPEFHGEFSKAASAGQAAWIKHNILSKQNDLEHLGDLGTAGNTGRFAAGFAFGIIDPINLVAMGASGGASVVARGAAQASKIAAATAAASRMRPVATGLATAGVLGGVAERLRQQYNFEDHSMGVLKASIASMAFSAPFIGLHMREQARLWKTAGMENAAYDAMAEQQAGHALTPEEAANLKQYVDKLQQATRAGAGVAEQVPEQNGPKFTATQRKAYEDAFAKYDAEQAALKDQQLGEVAVDSHIAKAAEDQRIATVLDRVNGPDAQPNAMQMAFAKALGKKPEELTARPEADASAGGIDAPWAADGAGMRDLPGLQHERAWWDDGSGMNEGRVVDENVRTGDLMVDHPETGVTTTVNRADLHDLSPGYVAPKPAEGFLGGSIGAAQVAPVSGLWEQPTAMTRWKNVPTRWDFFTHLNQSENPHLQFLGFKMVKDAIGIDPHEAQGWSASERKTHYRRQLAGQFHMEARRAYDDAIKARKLPLSKSIGYHRQFYEDVARVARGDADVLHANADIAPQLQQAAKAMTDFYAEMKTKLQKAQVKGAENLPDNPQYVNRQWRQDNIRTAFSKYGDDLYQAVANAIRVPGLTGDIAKAKSFMDAVMKLEFSHAMQDIHLYSKDMVTLRDELGKAGLKDTEVNSIVDLMFDRRAGNAGDAGQAPALKYRFALDENHMERMPDGTTFKLADLFENDSRVLIDRYMNSMGGHLSLAEVGIRSRAEFMQRMRDAEEWHADNTAMTQSAEKFNRNKQFAQDLYDNITGRPMSTQSFNRADRFLTATRGITRSAMLGQLGIQATIEMGNALALTSMRALRLHMPTFAGIIRSFRAGHRPTLGLVRDVEMITGFGREHVASYSRQHEITDYTYDRGISRYENISNTLSHAVDHMSGNSHITAGSRALTARMMVQKHLDFATERVKMSEKQRERMVHQGVSYDDQFDLHTALKKYTTMDPKTGAAQAIDWERWSVEQPENYSRFQLLLSREVRDAIQDHDIGESIPFMHTTVGKIFTELKTFVIAGHAKKFLKSLYYRDQTTFVQWAYSFVGASLEYSFQNAINFAHDPEKLKDKLSPDAIAMGAISRMAVLGLLPSLMETAYSPISGGRTLFTNGTANTDNRNLFITPSMNWAMRVMSAGQVAGASLNPLSTNTVTQKDMRDALYALPGGNLYGMRNLNDIISSNFPKYRASPEQ